MHLFCDVHSSRVSALCAGQAESESKKEPILESSSWRLKDVLDPPRDSDAPLREFPGLYRGSWVLAAAPVRVGGSATVGHCTGVHLSNPGLTYLATHASVLHRAIPLTILAVQPFFAPPSLPLHLPFRLIPAGGWRRAPKQLAHPDNSFRLARTPPSLSIRQADQLASQLLHRAASSRRAAIMWNDEDNNPYGTSFSRRDSQTSSSANPASPSSRDCEHVAKTFS